MSDLHARCTACGHAAYLHGVLRAATFWCIAWNGRVFCGCRGQVDRQAAGGVGSAFPQPSGLRGYETRPAPTVHA